MTRIFLAAALACVAACGSDGVTRPPQTTIQVFSAAGDFDTLRLVREQNSETSVGFGRSANVTFDSGQYDFRFQTLIAGLVPTDLYSFSATLDPSQQSTIVATSQAGDLTAFVVSSDFHDPDATTAKYTVIHADPGRGPIDVYLVPPGTPLATVAPQGTTTFGSVAAEFEAAAGTSRLYLTPAGDPTAPFYESVDLTVAAGANKTLVIFDPGEQSLAEVDVVDLIRQGAARFIQVGVDARFRTVMAVDDRIEDREIYLNDDTTPFIGSPLPFGEPTPSMPIPVDVLNINLTPAGSPGTVESTTPLNTVAGLSYLTAFAGDTTEGINPTTLVEDTRPIVGQATVRVIHAAGLFDGVVVFIYETGTNTSLVAPNVDFIRAPAVSARLPFLPDDYEITIRDRSTNTLLADPIPVTLEDGGVYGLLLVNSEDGSSVEVRYLYDTPL